MGSPSDRHPVFSLNAPVPTAADRLADDLAPLLYEFDRRRDPLTLVCKRLGSPDSPRAYAELEERARTALRGTPAFEARITGLDAFLEPAAGPGPVVYLAVESPGLRRAHGDLVDALGAVEGLEGEDYTPHVTLARGGSRAAVERLHERAIEPITWTVEELFFWDASRGERVSAVALPAT